MSIRRTPSRILPIVFAAMALVCVSAFTGCASFWTPVNNSTTGGNTGTGFDIVYAGKNSGTTFVGYQVLSTGLTPVTGSPFNLGVAPLSMAITPTDTFLYVGTVNGISGYSIAAGGVLTALNGGTAVATPAAASAMDISPDGNWLVVLDVVPGGATNTMNLLTYQINPSTGALTNVLQNVASLPFPFPSTTPAQITNGTNAVAQAVKFAPDEKTQTASVIAASLGTGGEWTFTFNSSTGAISAVNFDQPNSTTIQENGVAWSADSTTLYFLRGGSVSQSALYGVNTSTGVFTTSTAIAGPPTGNNPSSLSFSPNQNDLYITNANDDTISGYSVAVSGSTITFTPLSMSPYSTSGFAPYAITFDNSATYMLAMNQTGPPDLIQYTIDGVLDSGTSTTPGRLFVNSSVSTGLTAIAGSGPGITMAATH